MTYDKQQAGEMTFITADQDMTMRQQLADLRAALRGAGIQSLIVGGRSLKLRQGALGQANRQPPYLAVFNVGEVPSSYLRVGIRDSGDGTAFCWGEDQRTAHPAGDMAGAASAVVSALLRASANWLEVGQNATDRHAPVDQARAEVR